MCKKRYKIFITFLVKKHKVGTNIGHMEHSFKEYFVIKTSKDMTKNINPKESKQQPNQENLKNRSAMKQQSEKVKEEQVSDKKVQKNSKLEQNNVEYKTYFHCINCNTDVFKNTEAFVHLGK